MLTGFGKTGRRGPVRGRERALCLPGHGNGAAGCAGMHAATRRARERWAAQNGVASRCWFRLAATGGFATAEAAGVSDAHRHRHLRPSKRACGALAREKGMCTTRQDTRVISEKSLTKTTLQLTLKLIFTENAHEQCRPSVRRNDFGMWGF